MEKKGTVVLYPGVGVGHLTPMLELARELLRHGGAINVTIVLVEPPDHVSDPGFPATVARAKAAYTSVAFHVLPLPTPPAGPDADSHMAWRFRLLRAMNAPLRDFLRSPSSPVLALVLDMFCGDAVDVAAELGLPAYFFFPSGGASLAVFLGLPGLKTEFRALGGDAVLSFPGAPRFRVSDLPAEMTDDGETSRATLRVAARIPDARGILVNTFEALEPRAVRALRDGLCVPCGSTPPVYCVEPLVSRGGGSEQHDCLRWLDSQPDRSVVFLCFGSMGAFFKKQLEEIAVGLERSGQRFLWVVRSQYGSAGNMSGDPLPERPTTSTPSFRNGSWSGPRTEASSSAPGHRRQTCSATGGPVRS